jgi:hypothetical protein
MQNPCRGRCTGIICTSHERAQIPKIASVLVFALHHNGFELTRNAPTSNWY